MVRFDCLTPTHPVPLSTQPGQSEREINPFWKDGGKGLPEAKRNLPTVKPGIADGGAGWLRKAFQRIVERAKQEDRSVADLAAEKWGVSCHYFFSFFFFFKEKSAVETVFFESNL